MYRFQLHGVLVLEDQRVLVGVNALLCASCVAAVPGRWTRVWAPVFSSAVYAAGTEALAQTSAGDWLHQLAVVSALATLGLWLANTILCGISYITEAERT